MVFLEVRKKFGGGAVFAQSGVNGLREVALQQGRVASFIFMRAIVCVGQDSLMNGA